MGPAYRIAYASDRFLTGTTLLEQVQLQLEPHQLGQGLQLTPRSSGPSSNRITPIEASTVPFAVPFVRVPQSANDW